MNEVEFASLIARGYEPPDVEYKGPGRRSDNNLLGKVARAVLGMANRRGGGRVILGVSDDHDALAAKGLEEDELSSWNNFDILSEKINQYASPSVAFDLEVQDYQGKKFIILIVHEFDDIPVLCRKDFTVKSGKKDTQILRKGACYVRSRHRPETSEIPSEEEMRALLDLAIEKGVKRFLERAQRVGLYPQDHPTAPEHLDVESFEEQKENFQ